MSKFKLSLPLRISDLRDHLLKLQQELTLLKSSYRAAGVTTAQGQMLLEIERSGPLNVVTLTGLLGLDKSTVSQTLAQLQRLSWVELRENEADRRYKTVSLTADGEARVRLVQQKFDDQLTELLADLKDQEKNAVGFGIGLFSTVLESNRLGKQTEPAPSEAQTIKEKSHPLYIAEKKELI